MTPYERTYFYVVLSALHNAYINRDLPTAYDLLMEQAAKYNKRISNAVR